MLHVHPTGAVVDKEFLDIFFYLLLPRGKGTSCWYVGVLPIDQLCTGRAELLANFLSCGCIS